MTDRELLEAAARAAGLFDDGYRPVLRAGEGWVCIRPATDKFPFQSVWAPLTDDGDEARLEAAIGIDVTWLLDQVCVHDSWERFADHGGDKQAARRRAGVRAAASLGERGKG